MPNSLGLDDDLDDAELNRDIEQIFDVSISNAEARSITRVGDLFDLLLSKIPQDDADAKCPTAMAYLRVSKALEQSGHGRRLAPSTDLQFLEDGRAKANLLRLEAETGLRMPRAVPSRTGRRAALLGFLGTAALVFSLDPGGGAAVLGVLAGLILSFVILRYADPGALPAHTRTLGDLTRAVASMNYGRLIKMGARHTDQDVWDNLVEVLSRYQLPKSAINRETFFLQSQLKRSGTG